MTRDELVSETRRLVDEGERLRAAPSTTSLRPWLQLSDELLAAAWGSMDRYHLAWLTVGRPASRVRGRAMTFEEEAAYVRAVAEAKTAVLRMSLEAVLRGMPFVGESGGVGAPPAEAVAPLDAPDAPRERRSRGALDEVADRLAEARRAADSHAGHAGRRAPRPERMER